MNYWFSRLSAAFLVISMTIGMPALASANQVKTMTVQHTLAALEKTAGGRLGVSAIDTSNNTLIEYRSGERFPVDSTSKAIVVAAILKYSMTHPHFLKKRILYTQKELDLAGSHTPVTTHYLAEGMTISELCAAAITQSDSAAMNLLIEKLGGLSAVNAFARSIGDKVFRLDRYEPALNTGIPGDLRDTSTPHAMRVDLQGLALGSLLAPSQRQDFLTWLKANTTGDARIRAGVPKGWIVGDKTGTGDYGTTNDIGIIWPPTCAPIVVAIYFTQAKQDAPPRDDVIAAAMQLVIHQFAQGDSCIKQQLPH